MTATAPRPWRCPRDHTCPSPTRHDNRRGYNAGCRSGEARAAQAEALRAWRAGQRPARIDATGTARRLQALVAAGHPIADLARRLYLARQVVHRLVVQHYPTVLETTAAKVDELWIELSETEPPDTRIAHQTRARAAAKKYLPAEAWDIDLIDDPTIGATWPGNRNRGKHARAVLNQRVGVTPLHPQEQQAAERAAEVARLTHAGRSLAEIADELGVTQRTVERIKARLAADADSEVAA